MPLKFVILKVKKVILNESIFIRSIEFLRVVIYPGGHKTCIRSIEYFPSSNNFLATAAVDGTAKVR